MSGAGKLPSPQARQKLLSGMAHDIRNSMQMLAVLQEQVLKASDTATRGLVEDLVEKSRQADFEVENFIEAAYAAVGVPKPAAKISVDDVLALATAPYRDSVTLRSSGLTVEAPRYALARVAREMVGILFRAGLGTKAEISATAARGKLVIEAVATRASERSSPARLRDLIDSTFANVTALAGSQVTVMKGGRGVRAALRAVVQDDSRPLVLVLSADGRLAKEVQRATSGMGLAVAGRPTSLAILTELQEAMSPAGIAACVIDAGVQDELTGRLYQALGRPGLTELVLVAVAEGDSVPDAEKAVRIVKRTDLPSALRVVLKSRATATPR